MQRTLHEVDSKKILHARKRTCACKNTTDNIDTSSKAQTTSGEQDLPLSAYCFSPLHFSPFTDCEALRSSAGKRDNKPHTHKGTMTLVSAIAFTKD